MASPLANVRVHIQPRQAPPRSEENPRAAFWQLLRQASAPGYSDVTFDQLEGQLERQLGETLHGKLLSALQRGLEQLDSSHYGSRFFRLMEEGFPFRGPERSSSAYQALDAFARIAESREQSFREIPELKKAREKLAIAGSVVFRTRIAGYGSLDIDITTAPIDALARIFDFDVAAFEVFLGAYVPEAFANTFGSSFADQLRFDVSVPDSVANAFRSAAPTIAAAPAVTRDAPGPTVTDSQRKAEILWRVANGSLLVPVVLALAVMFYGLRAIADVQRSQLDALKPILEHQAALLREDRERLAVARADSAVRQAGSKRP